MWSFILRRLLYNIPVYLGIILLVMALLRVRDDVTGVKGLGDAWSETLVEIQSEINRIVNRMFEKRLRAIPQVASYLDMLG